MSGAIRSELRKIFSTRLWWGLVLAIVLISGGTSAGFAALVGSDVAGDNAADNPFLQMSLGTAQLVYSGGFVYNLTPLIPLALGVILITQEFRHQTISSTFLATPKRSEVLVAKSVAIVAIGIVYGIVHDIVSAGLGSLVLSAKGYSPYLGDADVWRTFAVSVLCFVLWALVGFGVGTLVRNQLAAVFAALGVGFIGHIALSIVFGALGWDVAGRLLPDNLSVGMLVTNDPTGGAGGDSPYFTWWACSLILFGYALVLAGLGSWLLSRRDVS